MTRESDARPGLAIDVADLSVTYHTSAEPVRAIDSVSLRCHPGEFISIIGPSGCGKSTLLRAVAGLEKPTSGRITIGDASPERAQRERIFGIVFQEPVLLAWRTNLDNVCLPLEVLGVRGKERREKGLRLLQDVDLREFADRYPRQLSGGMRQRVSIARALSYDPAVLLMDEPFGALDELTRTAMNEDMQRLWMRTGKSVLFVTHSIGEAVYLSDRVLVMSPRPAIVRAVVEVELPRPRRVADRDSVEFAKYTRIVREHLGMEGGSSDINPGKESPCDTG